MKWFYIFWIDRYDPNTYHFIGSPTADELHPQSREGETKWARVRAKNADAAVEQWCSYVNENVTFLGPCEFAAVEVDNFVEVQYAGYIFEGTIELESEEEL